MNKVKNAKSAGKKIQKAKGGKTNPTNVKKLIMSKEVIRGRRPKHPNFREIEVIMTDGTKMKIFSSYKKDIMQLDIDPKNHPAWNKDKKIVIMEKGGKAAALQSLYGSMED